MGRTIVLTPVPWARAAGSRGGPGPLRAGRAWQATRVGCWQARCQEGPSRFGRPGGERGTIRCPPSLRSAEGYHMITQTNHDLLIGPQQRATPGCVADLTAKRRADASARALVYSNGPGGAGVILPPVNGEQEGDHAS